MINFRYFELIAFFYAGIFDQIKQGTAFEMAVNISFDSFWSYPEQENRLSNLILTIHGLNVDYAMNKSFAAKQIEIYENHLEWIKSDDLTRLLEPYELEHFNETIYNLNIEIDRFRKKSDSSK